MAATQMTPADQDALTRVVLAGKKLMYDPRTHKILLAGIQNSMPMPRKLAMEALGLVKMLNEKARGSIPRQVLIPAALQLLLEVAKFMVDSKLGQPSKDDIQAAMVLLVHLAQKLFGQAPGTAPAASPASQPGGLINQPAGA